MVIGLTGRKSAGKDTVASYLVERYDFKRLAYADALKEAAAALFQVPVSAFDYHKNNPQVRVQLVRHYDTPGIKEATEHMSNMTLRQFLQRMGTEMGREVFGKNFWVEQLQKKLKDRNGKYVITDVRFDNEVLVCDTIIEIVRPGLAQDTHASEAGLDEDLVNYIVVNNGTIDELHEKVEECLQQLLMDKNAG